MLISSGRRLRRVLQVVVTISLLSVGLLPLVSCANRVGPRLRTRWRTQGRSALRHRRPREGRSW
jgi:hypothetical protein